MKQKLRLTEIFYSLQGESIYTGLPSIFIRLTGCPLRCQYCDTAYAFQGGEVFELEQILLTIQAYKSKYVCVTGGEPLAQIACITLLQQLCDKGYKVSLETSGARDISQVPSEVMIVMDLKTPDSLEVEKNLLTNIPYLKPKDQIKFVLCSRKDYDWACEMIKSHNLDQKAQLLFSPSWHQLDHKLLADWILQDALPVRFQLQLHKILWNDTPGR